MKIRDAWFYPFIVIVALSVGYHADKLWVKWIHNSLPTPGPTSIEGEADEPEWILESMTVYCGQCGQEIAIDPNQ